MTTTIKTFAAVAFAAAALTLSTPPAMRSQASSSEWSEPQT
jgi:hypothetical protein